MTTVSNRVFARDNFGRFRANLDNAARATVSEVLDVGVAHSRAAAPMRTGALRASFSKTMISAHSGVYGNSRSYAKFQDQGVGPNLKPADVSFFWEGEGRMWRADTTGTQVINHPGNPATHFMLAGWRAMQAAAPSITAKHYG